MGSAVGAVGGDSGMVRLKPGRDARARAGHPWVYEGEISRIRSNPPDGSIVAVCAASGAFIGRGYINRASQITVRILTWKDEPVDDEWFARRLRDAFGYRDLVAPNARSCRMVHSEGDGLPGLIVDRYEDCLVFQFLTLGMDLRKDALVRTSLELAGLEDAYERSDVRSREYEGLGQRSGFLSAPFDASSVQIRENGYALDVDVAGGQKTGHFLDQRENRAALAPYCRGARVLDCFCHTGAFAIHAAGFGAREVLGVDISEQALVTARRNAALNRLDEVCTFRAGNVFDTLRQMADDAAARRAREGQFDMVILDPPAFTKSRATVESAARGYKEINLRAAMLLPEGGFLVTSSCSHHVDEPTFVAIVESALADAGRRARLVEARTQAKDHPVMAGVPETRYLKFLVFRMM
jgi:23S rRNA (cytosine1962-C5)-methyltransferase